MADIDKITASNGTTYNIKDSTARDSISQLPSSLGYYADASDSTTYNVTVGITGSRWRPVLVLTSVGAWLVSARNTTDTTCQCVALGIIESTTLTVSRSGQVITLTFSRTVYGGVRCYMFN